MAKFLFSLLSLLIWVGITSCDFSSESKSTAPTDTMTCTYEGKEYDAGSSFPANDDCNSCSCTEEGDIACTEMACLSSTPEEAKSSSSQTTPSSATTIISLSSVTNTTPSSNLSSNSILSSSSEITITASSISLTCDAQEAQVTYNDDPNVMCTMALVPFGWKWNGSDCEEVIANNGCGTCTGADCSDLFATQEECTTAFTSCMPSIL